IISECAGSEEYSAALALSEDGTILVSASKGGEVLLWDVATGLEKRRWRIKNDDNSFLFAISPGGASVAAVLNWSRSKDPPEKFIHCWNAADGQLRFALPHPDGDRGHGFDGAVFVSDDVLVTASNGMHLYWWETSTGKLIQHDDLSSEFRGN